MTGAPCPQVKEQHAEAARAEALPAGRPELCPTSRKLLEHIRGRSVVAAGQVCIVHTTCGNRSLKWQCSDLVGAQQITSPRT